MKKIYFLVPLVCLLVFSLFYWNAYKSIEQRELDKKHAAEELRQHKLQDEVKAREKAYQDAVVQAERRKKEKAERETKEQADRDAKEALVAERDKMYREEERLARQIERQTKDVDAEKEEINKIEEQKRSYLAEQEFLRSYVKQAETNQKGLDEVLNKIAAADKAVADAAKAAAAKAKS